jgi:hypothetical protein
MGRGVDILIYEEGEDFWTDIGRKHRCRVMWYSTSGITSDFKVQEEVNGEWVDVPECSEVEREVLSDCIYFASMSYMSETPERRQRADQGLPRVDGYNVGP